MADTASCIKKNQVALKQFFFFKFYTIGILVTCGSGKYQSKYLVSQCACVSTAINSFFRCTAISVTCAPPFFNGPNKNGW